ncbi:MAG TPA: hypothetical protein PLT76_06800 [Candidatus Omnitrophota bacterium]|nr:hypothetical protein [Candidatus Omnitrophota bacterium]HPB67825.1 hypothetical protein [Candidatus Omnitrophota bacterium]HQO58415.1 hypothetical protein [Candidatus Omnitrophota bacterium]HQP12441.1 hypothetical protein [Candidatus Omnitrophota bacterium]
MIHLIYNLFAYPSAWLTAVFHGAGMVPDQGGEVWILLEPRPIHVTLGCSGFGFFALLGFYTLTVLARGGSRRRAWKAACWVIPTVYLTTIFANAARMTCAYHVACLSRALFPAYFQPVIHMAVGIAVFLGVLIVSHLVTERFGFYEQ